MPEVSVFCRIFSEHLQKSRFVLGFHEIAYPRLKKRMEMWDIPVRENFAPVHQSSKYRYTATTKCVPDASPPTRLTRPPQVAAAARAQILGALAPGVDFADWDNARMRQAWYGDEASKVD